MNEHSEYIENAHNFDSTNLTDEEVEQWGSILFQTDKKLDEKKKALGILAHVGNLVAWQLLKEYSMHPDKGLEEWAKIAYGECTLFLHAELAGDDDEEFVFTGVGENNNMLRIYMMVLPKEEEKPLETWQQTIVKNEMTYAARDLKCEVEWFDCRDNFVSLSLLMPTNVAIATYIEKGIENCNLFGGFLHEEYYCASGVPDENEIDEIIHIVRYGEEE